MLREIFLLAAISAMAQATPVPGDTEESALEQLGDVRAKIPLSDGNTTILVFDRGEIWVKEGRITKTNLLSANAYAEAKIKDAARRERERAAADAASKEKEARQIQVQAAQAAKERRDQEALDQVRRELLDPDMVTDFKFGPFTPSEPIKKGEVGIVIHLAPPGDFQSSSSGRVLRVFADMVHTGETEVYASRLLATFLDNKGQVLRTVHIYIGNILPGESRPLSLNVYDYSSRRGIGDGADVTEVRFDLFSDRGLRLPIHQSRWIKTDLDLANFERKDRIRDIRTPGGIIPNPVARPPR